MFIHGHNVVIFPYGATEIRGELGLGIENMHQHMVIGCSHARCAERGWRGLQEMRICAEPFYIMS